MLPAWAKPEPFGLRSLTWKAGLDGTAVGVGGGGVLVGGIGVGDGVWVGAWAQPGSRTTLPASTTSAPSESARPSRAAPRRRLTLPCAIIVPAKGSGDARSTWPAA